MSKEKRSSASPTLRGLVTALTFLIALLVWGNPVGAADEEIVIAFDEIVRSPAGSVVRADSVDVADAMVGAQCAMDVVTRNQVSVHPGNDLIVTTGSSQAVIVGVEDTANRDINQDYSMVLGPTIDVDMRIGGDGMSSLGFELVFRCAEPTPPPTVADVPLVERSVPPAPQIDTGQVTAPTQPPTTAPPAPTTTAAPVTTPAPTEATSSGGSGLQTTGDGLSETPAAAPVSGQPNYTG